MKKLFFAAAFLTGIVSVFAFSPKPTFTSGFYQSGSSCLPGSTNETGCSTANEGTQCTINVTGNPPAQNLGDCTQPLRLK